MDTKPQKGIDYIGVCVCYFCHDGQGNFVMHRRGTGARDEHGTWDIGGGGLKFSETIEQALHRELSEEYGTVPVSYELLGQREALREHNGKPTHWISLDFKVLVDPSTVSNNEPATIDALEWVTLETIPDPLHSQLLKFFTVYKGRL
jgi:8-oxo-dGTP diphosphatase